MNDTDKLKRQFDRAAIIAETQKNKKLSPADMAEIIYGLQSGAWAKIADYIMDYCTEQGIDRHAPELTQFEREATEGRAREAREHREKSVAALTEKITHYQKNLAGGVDLADPGFLSLAGEIGKEATALGAAVNERDRIGTWESYIQKCKDDDPSKDFRPSFFAGLGFPSGTVSYIGARAKVGKTTAMINLAREAMNTDRKVFFITLEMSRKQLLTKLALSITYALTGPTADRGELLYLGSKERKEKSDRTPSKDYYALMKGLSLTDEPGIKTFIKYTNLAIDKIKAIYGNKLIIYDGRGATFPEIISAIKIHGGPGVLILLDYIQRMPPVDENGSDTYMRLKKISDGVLTAAADTDSIVVSGAQLNRTVIKNENGEEIINADQFRESGDIEQDGHNLLGMGRLAEQGSRYIKMLAAREEMVEDDAYSIDFNGAYSYMKIGEKIKAPETTEGQGYKSGLGLGKGYGTLSDQEKETGKEAARKAIDKLRDKQKPEPKKSGLNLWTPGGKI
jgi:hypothetical protein